jgi:hypothetical protein
MLYEEFTGGIIEAAMTIASHSASTAYSAYSALKFRVINLSKTHIKSWKTTNSYHLREVVRISL